MESVASQGELTGGGGGGLELGFVYDAYDGKPNSDICKSKGPALASQALFKLGLTGRDQTK